jgi:hypothetical protein
MTNEVWMKKIKMVALPEDTATNACKMMTPIQRPVKTAKIITQLGLEQWMQLVVIDVPSGAMHSPQRAPVRPVEQRFTKGDRNLEAESNSSLALMLSIALALQKPGGHLIA